MNRQTFAVLEAVAEGRVTPAHIATAKYLVARELAPAPKKTPIASLAHVKTRRVGEERDAKAQRQEVRATVMERAGGLCEACGARRGPALHLDHFHGRAREESVESCWALCPRCDDEKTNNRPSRAFWLRRFRTHCQIHGYAEQVDKCTRLVDLEYAQHPEQLAPPVAPPTTQEKPTCPF